MSITLSQITNIRNLDGRVSRYDILALEAGGVVIRRAKYQGKISIVKNRQLEVDGTTATKVLSLVPPLKSYLTFS